MVALKIQKYDNLVYQTPYKSFGKNHTQLHLISDKKLEAFEKECRAEVAKRIKLDAKNKRNTALATKLLDKNGLLDYFDLEYVAFDFKEDVFMEECFINLMPEEFSKKDTTISPEFYFVYNVLRNTLLRVEDYVLRSIVINASDGFVECRKNMLKFAAAQLGLGLEVKIKKQTIADLLLK